MNKTKVTIAGAGPGAVDLITLRALEALKNADVIIYAGSLINPEILKYAGKDAEKISSAGLALPDVIEIIKNGVEAGKNVVRLHTGDPAMYGAISEQMNELDKLGIEYEVIPGVSSAFAAMAAVQAEMTMPGITQTAIFTRRAGRTPVPDGEKLAKLADNNATLVLFLSVSDMPELVDDILKAGRPPDTPVAVVYRASWPNEKIVTGTLADISEKVAEAGIQRQAIVLVGAALMRGGEKSLLYDKYFAHGYRNSLSDKTVFSGRSAVFAITHDASAKAGEIAEGLQNADVYIPERFSDIFPSFATFPKGGLKKLIEKSWNKYDALIFVMATGIVIRQIKDLIRSKLEDPAVVVCDEMGNHVISLLSGHIGGANRLAGKIAGITGGTAVITTATDVQGMTAFDEMAAIENLKIMNPEKIKLLNSALLAGENIDIVMPEELFQKYYAEIRGIRKVETPHEITSPNAVVVTDGKLQFKSNIQ